MSSFYIVLGVLLNIFFVITIWTTISIFKQNKREDLGKLRQDLDNLERELQEINLEIEKKKRELELKKQYLS